MAPETEGFPRQYRLTRDGDILRVRTDGIRVHTRWFDLRWCPSPTSHVRIAIIVPRFGRTAAARNRVKRRLREAARRVLIRSIPPRDIVVRALPSAYHATFDALARAFQDVAGRVST